MLVGRADMGVLEWGWGEADARAALVLSTNRRRSALDLNFVLKGVDAGTSCGDLEFRSLIGDITVDARPSSRTVE